MLYSREFFDLVKRRLNPGGVVTLFVQLYSSNEEAVKSEIATFFEAFPNGIVFGNTYNGAGYDLVLLGQPIRRRSTSTRSPRASTSRSTRRSRSRCARSASRRHRPAVDVRRRRAATSAAGCRTR